MKKEKIGLKQYKGFTLVELIVVIIIVAVIATIALPRIVRFQDEARKVRIQVEHRQLITAINAYIGKQKDVELAFDNLNRNGGFDSLKPYMSVKQGLELSDTLAKDGNGQVAHRIEGNKLISTFTPTGTSLLEGQTWEYRITMVN